MGAHPKRSCKRGASAPTRRCHVRHRGPSATLCAATSGWERQNCGPSSSVSALIRSPAARRRTATAVSTQAATRARGTRLSARHAAPTGAVNLCAPPRLLEEGWGRDGGRKRQQMEHGEEEELLTEGSAGRRCCSARSLLSSWGKAGDAAGTEQHGCVLRVLSSTSEQLQSCCRQRSVHPGLSDPPPIKAVSG